MVERVNALRPDAGRARALDQRMRVRLIESLRHVAQCAGEHLNATALEPACARMLRAPLDPLVFGAYYDLVFALEADDLDAAQSCLDELLAVEIHEPSTRIIPLPDPVHPAGARYVRLLDTDPDVPFDVVTPAQDQVRLARARVEGAFAMLDAHHPALADELRALVRTVVLASPGPAMRGTTFDGASSFMLWGAVVLNTDGHEDAWAMLQALVHESGHNLLFGLSADGPLVENDDAERFDSPLRADPRPMDGIIHATFVCARVHAAIRAVITRNALDERGHARALSDLCLHAEGFRQGLDVVQRHARLTALGQAVLDEAVTTMRDAD